jgi:hypothetical protein
MEKMEKKSSLMIHSLRRRHFFTWIILSMVLPVLFIASWRAIPVSFSQPEILKQSTPGVEEVLSSNQPWAQTSQFRKGSQYYLEVQIKKPLLVPGTVLYIGKNESSTVEESLLLGRIESMRTYQFKTSENIEGKGSFLLFFDPFHRKVIHRLPI